MKVLVSVATLAAMVASPAAAQDNSTKFGGFYAGPVIGVDKFENDDDDRDSSGSGVVYGGLVGYDWDAGKTVFGLDAELLESSITDKASNVFLPGDGLTFGVGLDLYLGARAGFKVGPRGLLYLKGGYTNLDLNAAYAAPDVATIRDKQSFDGYRIGAGGEMKLSRNLAARIEYRYSNYGSGGSEDGFDEFDIERHQGIASLLFRI